MGDTIRRHQGCCTKTRSLSSPSLSLDDNILGFSGSRVPILELDLGNGEPRVDGCRTEQGHHSRSWAHLESELRTVE